MAPRNEFENMRNPGKGGGESDAEVWVFCYLGRGTPAKVTEQPTVVLPGPNTMTADLVGPTPKVNHHFRALADHVRSLLRPPSRLHTTTQEVSKVFWMSTKATNVWVELREERTSTRELTKTSVLHRKPP